MTQIQRQQEYISADFGPRIPPFAPEPPTMRSFHPSAVHDDSSTRSTVRQPAAYNPRPDPRVQMGAVEEEPFPNIDRQTARSQTGASLQVSEVDHNKPTDQLRLKIDLGECATAIQIWVNLAGPCELFYNTFHKQVEKRGVKYDRSSACIAVRTDKNTPKSKAYDIHLDERTLVADWNETVAYLDSHKATTTPHLIGILESDDD